jgi:hypothetical protein
MDRNYLPSGQENRIQLSAPKLSALRKGQQGGPGEIFLTAEAWS